MQTLSFKMQAALERLKKSGTWAPHEAQSHSSVLLTGAFGAVALSVNSKGYVCFKMEVEIFLV